MSTIVRIFIDHADAEAARQTVLRSGLTLDCVALSYQGDEAGAVRGNFVSGDHQPRGEMAETYESKFQNVVLGGRYVLIVEADPTEAAATEVILAKAGGAAIDDLCPGAPTSMWARRIRGSPSAAACLCPPPITRRPASPSFTRRCRRP